MGLALYNPTASMADLNQDKQEPTPASQPRVSSKRRDHGARQQHHAAMVDAGDLRQRLSDRNGTTLQAAHWLHRHSRPSASDGTTRTLPVSSPRTRPRSRLAWTTYVQEGAELAMPQTNRIFHIQPPPDRSRNGASTNNAAGRTRRPPSLERQGAFRAPGTSAPPRRRSSCDNDDHYRDDSTAGDDRDFEAVEAEDIADLYELGLLYEDEHLRGAGFGFEALAGQQYSLDLRRVVQRSRACRRKAPPALERRQHGGSAFLGRSGHVFGADDNDDLPLEDGSMRPLADHSDGISNFLIAPEADDLFGDLGDDFDLVSIPPDAEIFPDLVSDTDDWDDDGRSGSDWVVMSDLEQEPTSRTQ
ncbi:hypothetical protein RB594_008108 [Gaeumannomyces avenae]